MNYTRTLSYGMSGVDVRYIKNILFKLGYYDSKRVTRITNDKYLGDTRAAVKYFQAKHECEPSGDVDQLTWDWILLASTEEDTNIEENTTIDTSGILIPANIGSVARAKVLNDLAKVSAKRKDIVLDILQFAYDPATTPGQYPFSLYIRGGNIYNKDLSVNRISLSYITNTYPRSYPEFVTEGRAAFLIEAVEDNPNITGCDCSGGIVGECRKHQVVVNGFDANANTLCSDKYSVAISKAALQAGDWVGRPEHIGMYVGGGYVVEWIGGAYGCQLTKLDDRRIYNFKDRKGERFSGWTKFRDPKCY